MIAQAHTAHLSLDAGNKQGSCLANDSIDCPALPDGLLNKPVALPTGWRHSFQNRRQPELPGRVQLHGRELTATHKQAAPSERQEVTAAQGRQLGNELTALQTR